MYCQTGMSQSWLPQVHSSVQQQFETLLWVSWVSRNFLSVQAAPDSGLEVAWKSLQWVIWCITSGASVTGKAEVTSGGEWDQGLKSLARMSLTEHKPPSSGTWSSNCGCP